MIKLGKKVKIQTWEIKLKKHNIIIITLRPSIISSILKQINWIIKKMPLSLKLNAWFIYLKRKR